MLLKRLFVELAQELRNGLTEVRVERLAKLDHDIDTEKQLLKSELAPVTRAFHKGRLNSLEKQRVELLSKVQRIETVSDTDRGRTTAPSDDREDK